MEEEAWWVDALVALTWPALSCILVSFLILRRAHGHARAIELVDSFIASALVWPYMVFSSLLGWGSVAWWLNSIAGMITL